MTPGVRLSRDACTVTTVTLFNRVIDGVVIDLSQQLQKNRRKTFKGCFEIKTLTDMTNIKLHNHFRIAVFS